MYIFNKTSSMLCKYKAHENLYSKMQSRTHHRTDLKIIKKADNNIHILNFILKKGHNRNYKPSLLDFGTY